MRPAKCIKLGQWWENRLELVPADRRFRAREIAPETRNWGKYVVWDIVTTHTVPAKTRAIYFLLYFIKIARKKWRKAICQTYLAVKKPFKSHYGGVIH